MSSRRTTSIGSSGSSPRHAISDKQRRIACIEAAEEKMVEVRLLCRVLNDCKQMPRNLYAQMAFDMVEVDKHLSNWQRYNKQ